MFCFLFVYSDDQVMAGSSNELKEPETSCTPTVLVSLYA